MKQKDLISIIIPVYNVERYLNRCIDSVINQSYKNLEIILVDDGSTDTSGKICDEYAIKDNRIKVIHQKNAGVSNARNNGLKNAKAEYIGFVDSDDFIELDMYEYLHDLLLKYNADISICQVDYIKGDNIKYNMLLKENKIMTKEKALETLYTQLYNVNKLFKRNFIENIFFTEDVFVGEDMLFCLKCFEKVNKIIYGNKIKYHYIYNFSSATKNSFNIKKLTYFKAIDDFIKYTENNNLKRLYKNLKEQKVYHAVGFLKQIVESNFDNREVIKQLQNIVRKSIFLHILSKHKISNKLFALCVCINFNLANKFYKLLQ